MKSPINTPHDRFGRQTMRDTKITADVLRHYADPVIAQHVDLDNLKAEPTQELGAIPFRGICPSGAIFP